jgi:hypothetical protein
VQGSDSFAGAIVPVLSEYNILVNGIGTFCRKEPSTSYPGTGKADPKKVGKLTLFIIKGKYSLQDEGRPNSRRGL